MIVDSHLHLVKDSFGNKAYALCRNNFEKIHITGIFDSNGNGLEYEGTAFSLLEWCKLYELTHNVVTRRADFDAHWDDAEFRQLQKADRIRNETMISPEILENGTVTLDMVIKKQMMEVFNSMDVHRLKKYFEVFVLDPNKTLNENMELYHNDTLSTDEVRRRLGHMEEMEFGSSKPMRIKSTVITRSNRV